MRRALFLFAPLLLVLFTSRTAVASTLSVFPGCFNNGGGVAVCSPWVTGGTGTYVSYHWQYTETRLWTPPYSDSWTTTDPWLRHNCEIGRKITVTLTVTDSQGTTGVGTHTIYCSRWAD